MQTQLDLLRQTGVIPTQKLMETTVNIVGVGAIGSHIAHQLAKSGMQNVTLWDLDRISTHNIPNQHFSVDDIGKNKAVVMAEQIKRDTGMEYRVRKVWRKQSFKGLVFSCVDSMATRKAILEKMKEGMFIETRMGVYHGQIFSIDPRKEEQTKFWMGHYVGDDDVDMEVSACGTALTIGSTANLLASVATWQGIKYLNEEDLPRGLIVSVKPHLIKEI